MGLDDRAFPRAERPFEFDLMRHDWRPGDPRRGDEDRYLMLETLLCARRYLYFSYSGRSLKDDSERQPSVLLRELLDYVDRNFEPADGDACASRSITRVHSMQPFAPANFEPPARAYDGYWHATAKRLAAATVPEQPPTGWPGFALDPPATPLEIDIDDLCRFFAHPVRSFFERRLGLRLPEEPAAEDEECFALTALQKWELAGRLSHEWIAGGTPAPDAYRAEGLLPHGRAADWAWDGLLAEFDDLLARLEPYRGRAGSVRPVAIELGEACRLRGEITGCVDGHGLLRYSPSKQLRGRALVSLWLEHLALCAAGALAPDEQSRLLLAQAHNPRLAPLDAGEARSLLRSYTELMREGLTRPLPLFAETSLAWALGQDEGDAHKRARNAWYTASFPGARPGECEDRYIRLALPPGLADPLAEPRFRDLAARVYGAAIDSDSERA